MEVGEVAVYVGNLSEDSFYRLDGFGHIKFFVEVDFNTHSVFEKLIWLCDILLHERKDCRFVLLRVGIVWYNLGVLVGLVNQFGSYGILSRFFVMVERNIYYTHSEVFLLISFTIDAENTGSVLSCEINVILGEYCNLIGRNAPLLNFISGECCIVFDRPCPLTGKKSPNGFDVFEFVWLAIISQRVTNIFAELVYFGKL